VTVSTSSRSRQAKLLDAGVLGPEIGSFVLYLAAEGKAAKTIRTYTAAVARCRAPAEPGRLYPVAAGQ
jgi:hypothetical protein